MEIIINMKLTSLFIILLNLFLSINTQFNELTALKALSCVSLVTQKYRKGEEEPSHYSPIVLACFMKITEEQAQRIISGIEEGNIPLEPSEVDDLTDVERLKDYPQEEIEEKSQMLENTIKEFQKLDEEIEGLNENKYPENEDYDDDDYDYEYSDVNKNRKMSASGFFGLIKDGIGSFFSIAGGIWYAFFTLIIIYLILLIVRKSNELEKEMKKKENEEKSKEKKDKEREEKEKEKEKNIVNKKEKDNIKGKEKTKTD